MGCGLTQLEDLLPQKSLDALACRHVKVVFSLEPVEVYFLCLLVLLVQQICVTRYVILATQVQEARRRFPRVRGEDGKGFEGLLAVFGVRRDVVLTLLEVGGRANGKQRLREIAVL